MRKLYYIIIIYLLTVVRAYTLQEKQTQDEDIDRRR